MSKRKGFASFLRRLERAVMVILAPIGKVNNFVVLGVLFFLVLTPLGWLLRVAGARRIGSVPAGSSTYWKRRDKEVPQVDFRRIY